jgi:pantothenate kinase type III
MAAPASTPLLTADRGNSTLDLCLWRDGVEPEWRIRLPAGAPRERIAERIAGSRIAACHAATVVVGGLEELAAACEELGLAPPVVVGRDLPCPFEVLYADPSTLGHDRWLGCLGALQHLPADVEAVVLTVDCGTAATVNLAERAADGKLRFLGGAITAGAATLARGLAVAAPGLPQADLESAAPLPARSTPDAVSAGVQRGFVGAVDEIARACLAEFGLADDVPAFATGGHARLLLRHTRRRWIEAPQLVHEGLRALGVRVGR